MILSILFHAEPGLLLGWPFGLECSPIGSPVTSYRAGMHNPRPGSGPRTYYIRPSDQFKKYKKLFPNGEDFMNKFKFHWTVNNFATYYNPKPLWYYIIITTTIINLLLYYLSARPPIHSFSQQIGNLQSDPLCTIRGQTLGVQLLFACTYNIPQCVYNRLLKHRRPSHRPSLSITDDLAYFFTHLYNARQVSSANGKFMHRCI